LSDTINKLWNTKVFICGENITQVYRYGKIQNGYNVANPLLVDHEGLCSVIDDDNCSEINGTKLADEIALNFGAIPSMSKKEQLILIEKKMAEFDLKPKREIDPQIKKERNDRSNMINKRNKLIRIINCNPQLSTFLTLTFRDNITSFDSANASFDVFRRNMTDFMKRKHKLKFEYVAVIEFQERGAIHYHLLCNLPCPYIINREEKKKSDEQKTFENMVAEFLWLEGFVTVQPLTINPKFNNDNVDNVGAYLVKYMTKETTNLGCLNKKMYSTSRGLKKPIEVKFLDLSNVPSPLGSPNFSNHYTSMFTGDVVFEEYNKLRHTACSDINK
jgi:hypothetical protein